MTWSHVADDTGVGPLAVNRGVTGIPRGAVATVMRVPWGQFNKYMHCQTIDVKASVRKGLVRLVVAGLLDTEGCESKHSLCEIVR
jgi:hypothetical protein